MTELAGREGSEIVEIRLSEVQDEGEMLLLALLDDNIDAQEIRLVSSAALPDLERKPGKQNWIEHLPAALRSRWKKSWIYRAAKHLAAKGMGVGHAIATAINAARKGCTTGDLNFPLVQQVNVKSRAEMCGALAVWAAMKAAAKAKKAAA